MPRRTKISNTTIIRRSPRLTTNSNTTHNTSNTTERTNKPKAKQPTQTSDDESHQSDASSTGTNSENDNGDSQSTNSEDQSEQTNEPTTEDEVIELDDSSDNSSSTNTSDKSTTKHEDSDESDEDSSTNSANKEEDSLEGETEWIDTDNIATNQEVAAATNKGQLRFSVPTYKDAASKAQSNTVQEIQFKQRRMAIMVNIPEVDNNVDRLNHLVNEVNEFLKFARKNNTKFRLRPFTSTDEPQAKDKTKWRTRMIANDSADFRSYCQGYYPFSQVRGGNYRLRINAVMDKKVSLPTMIENITHDWGHQDNRSISDLKAQHIFDPVKIGYLMRATRYITHSHEVVEAFEWASKQAGYPDVHFGISWGAIPSPAGGYDKDTSVLAVIIETNRHTYTEAVDLLKQWYPLNPNKSSTPPYPGNFRFVINRDHPSVKGNSIAISNLSVLMERQGIFNMDTSAEQSYCLKGLDMTFSDNTKSIRKRLLEVKSETSGEEWKGKPLFMSISKSINSRTGQKSSWFAFHKAVTAEAQSIVKNLPIFMKSEWGIEPEECCYAQFLNERDEWDKRHRVANNEDTDELAMATKEYTADLQRKDTAEPTQQDDQTMTSKAAREMRRMMGGDNETVTSISKERQKKHSKKTPTAIDIDASKSVGSMSGISATSTKTSIVRAKLHQEFNNKFKDQEHQINQLLADKASREQETNQLRDEMKRMTAMLAELSTHLPNTNKSHEEEGSQNSGEDPKQKHQKEEPSVQSQSSNSYRNYTEDINPDYCSEEEFEDARDNEYLTHEDVEDQKEEEAKKKGIPYQRQPWHGPQPASIPLPDSPESDSSSSIEARRSPKKRIIFTNSNDDEHTTEELKFYTQSNREKKKRSTASGSSNPGDHG